MNLSISALNLLRAGIFAALVTALGARFGPAAGMKFVP